MKIIILPGYSKRNKEWAEDVEKYLETSGVGEVLVHEWKHWNGGPFSPKKELENILKEVGDDKFNIIAKSVGVMVAFRLIQKVSSQVNKVILCGIASTKGDDRKKLAKDALSNIKNKNIYCIQNENDPYTPYSEAKEFYHSINKAIEVIKKPSSKHHYPYNEEFKKVLV